MSADDHFSREQANLAKSLLLLGIISGSFMFEAFKLAGCFLSTSFGMGTLMSSEVAGGSEKSATVMTHMWPDPCVDSHVGVELPLAHEAALALLAGVGFLARVDSHVYVKLTLLAALFAALGAEKDRAHAAVGSHV